MANTEFSSSSLFTQKSWNYVPLQDVTEGKNLIADALRMGIIQRKDDTSRGPGDQVKYHLRYRPIGKGLLGAEVATGNEEALQYYQDSVNIDELRHVYQIPNEATIDSQRVGFDLPDDAVRGLTDWHVDRLELGLMWQLAGFTATSGVTWDGETYSSANERLRLTGLNTAVAPTTNRIVRPNSSLTTDQAVNADTTATFTLAMIDEAERLAATIRPYIKPLDGAPGGVKYRCYVHPDSWKQIIQDKTSAIQYRDLYLNGIAAGKSTVIQQSIVYSQTEIIATDKIPYGVHSSTSAAQTNVRRCVFAGRDAGALAFGRGFDAGDGDPVPGFMFREDTLDVGRLKRISLSNIFGIKKTQFNSLDNGCIVLAHYVP